MAAAAIAIAATCCLLFAARVIVGRRASKEAIGVPTPVARTPSTEASVYFLDTYRQRHTEATRFHRASHSAS